MAQLTKDLNINVFTISLFFDALPRSTDLCCRELRVNLLQCLPKGGLLEAILFHTLLSLLFKRFLESTHVCVVLPLRKQHRLVEDSLRRASLLLSTHFPGCPHLKHALNS